MVIEGPLYQDMIPSVLMPDVKPVRYSEGGFTLYDNRINKVRTYTPQISEVIKENGQLGVSIFGGVKVDVFLSDDGGALLDELEKNKSRILQSTNLIQIFIETDKDTFSKNVLKVIAGKITRNKEELDLADVLKPIYALNEQQIENILGAIFKQPKNFIATIWDALTTKLVVLPEKIVSTALGISIDLIENLRLSDSWWQMNDQKRNQASKDNEAADSKDIEKFIENLTAHAKKAVEKISSINKTLADKYLKKLKGTLLDISGKLQKVITAMQQFIDWIQTVVRESGWFTRGVVAFLCGVWNGLVDMVTGLLFIVKVVLDGSKAVKQGAVSVINSRERLLEEVDNFYDSLGNVAWKEVYAEITEQVKALPSLLDLVNASLEKLKQAKDKAVKEVSEISKSEWAYYIGYGITFVIPTAAIANLLGKAGKFGKTFGKFLNWIDSVLNELFQFGLQKTGAIADKLLTVLKNITARLRKGSAEISKIIKLFFTKLREWLEIFVGKIGEAGIKVIDNALMTVERITKKVNDKLTEFYLITYKKTNTQLLCTIIPIEPFITLAKDLLTWSARKNLRALADEGFELLEREGRYMLKYGEEIIELGELKQAAQELNKIFDKSTVAKSKTALEEWIELVKKRKTVFEKWATKFDESFINHLSGDVELIKVKFTDVWKSAETWLYKGIQGQGGHWLNEFIIVRKIIPPPAVTRVADIPLDTPFRAMIDIKSLKGNLFPKREVSSMFPRNWSKERIQEEVAWVYENTVAKGIEPFDTSNKFIKYRFYSSDGSFKILIEVDDAGNIMNAYPHIN